MYRKKLGQHPKVILLHQNSCPSYMTKQLSSSLLWIKMRVNTAVRQTIHIFITIFIITSIIIIEFLNKQWLQSFPCNIFYEKPKSAACTVRISSCEYPASIVLRLVVSWNEEPAWSKMLQWAAHCRWQSWSCPLASAVELTLIVWCSERTWSRPA